MRETAMERQRDKHKNRPIQTHKTDTVRTPDRKSETDGEEERGCTERVISCVQCNILLVKYSIELHTRAVL